jgi:hypothetical protein
MRDRRVVAGEGDASADVYDVQVRDIGEAVLRDDGTVGLAPGDLGDRMEW